MTEEEKSFAIETHVPHGVTAFAISVLDEDGRIKHTIYVDTQTGETEVELPE